MRRAALALILLVILSACYEAGAEEAAWYKEPVSPYCHRSPDCAWARDSEPVSRESVDPFYACPVCGDDFAEYDGVEVVERGGTVMLRIPESWMEAQIDDGSATPCDAPEALLHASEGQDMDLARLLHGERYRKCLALSVGGSTLQTRACVPECASEDALVMSLRHLGKAWYMAVRPGKSLYKGGMLRLPVNLYWLDLEVRRWPAGFTVEPGRDDSLRWSGEIAVRPSKSSGNVVFRYDFDDVKVTALLDGSLCTAVFRTEAGQTERWLKYLGDVTPLRGYGDGGEDVFCCALTGAELAGLEELFSPDLDYVPAGQAEGNPAELSAVPVTSALLPGGAVAAMDQAAYPVGTAFVSYTLTLPEGGIGHYSSELELQRRAEGRWMPRTSSVLRARTDRGDEGESSGYFCKSKTIIVPLADVGVLEEGRYRLRVDSDEGDVDTWLEFDIAADAAEPVMPDVAGQTGFIPVAAHAVPHQSAQYNSCMDTTVLRARGRLLVGDTVFDLRGVDESWGWGIESHYGLFAWPEGRPEEAVMVVEDLDVTSASLYDAGDGLWLWDGEVQRFYHLDYDGGNLTALPPIFADTEPWVRDFLPVGDGVYLATNEGIWRAALDGSAPVRVYVAEQGIDNDSSGGGYMVIVDGTLFISDGGLVALDTLNPGADGMLPARRLTSHYDPDDGEAGYGYIALNGRLYGWSVPEKKTMSMAYDGSDVQFVSDERFWFAGVATDGTVLALTGKLEDAWLGGWSACALYYPIDPDHPDFDPDHCEKRYLEEDDYVYFFGDSVYCNGERMDWK